jgi:hypothetical protein
LRITIPVVKAKDDDVHWFSVEVNEDVATIYIDNEEFCSTDFENIEDLIMAIEVWANWTRVEKEAKT